MMADAAQNINYCCAGNRLAEKPWWFQLLFWGLVAVSLALLLLVNQLDPGSIPPGTCVGACPPSLDPIPMRSPNSDGGQCSEARARGVDLALDDPCH